MGESNKVLAVSYGTFSCRLEGFDDSVETMKTVVEYFHDLAGHDRFIDMEPMLPDVDTLTQLAEDQTGESVEATVNDEGVNLRVTPAEPVADEVEEIEAATETDEVPAAELNDVDDVVAAEDVDEFMAGEDTLEEVDAIDEFDDLALTPEEEAELEAEEEVELEAEEVELEAEEVAEEDAPAVAADEEAYEEDEAYDYVPTPTAAPVAPEDSVAAKLQRIRSVVGRVAPDADTAAPKQELTPDQSLSAKLAGLAAAADETAEDEAPVVSKDIIDDFHFDDDADEIDEEVAIAEDMIEDEFDDEIAEIEEEAEPVEEEVAEQDDHHTPTLSEEIAAAEREIAEQRDNPPARRETNLSDNVDDSMTRILTQTDEQMNEPEGSRRRNAISQLKAAVAATEAARQLGDRKDAAKETEEVFREDLDEAMRPLRLTDPAPRNDRAGSTPLKLVASQRVDEDAAPATRLRQIASVKESTGTKDGGFAAFASQMGATELGDLLEAAAAYTAFVEGAEDFSRPQVMKKVQVASADQFSREDGLRSFGMLLRQGRINKLSNGRFQIADGTKFRPTGHAARG